MNFRKSRNRSRKTSLIRVSGSEKWRQYGKRMSRRGTSVLRNMESDDEMNGDDDIIDWEEEFYKNKRISEDSSDEDVEVSLTKKQTLILSTLVPDELLILDSFNSVEPKRFVGVLLMADVSGYTALSERYQNTGKGGTYRLTVTLNTYLGALIELIYSHGGDVLKFAGDAFLALWKTDKRTFLSHTIHNVIACALVIQHSYATYETDVKVNLKVKLAIAAGNLLFAPIGVGMDMTYVIFGLPVLEAKRAESVCASGEVKLTATAWGHCYSRNYDHIIHEDGHVTIKSILYDPHEKDVTKPFHGIGTLVRHRNKNILAVENLPESLWGSSEHLSGIDTLKIYDALSLRKTILVAEDKNIGSEIRKFMIRPVLTQLDAHQPLEYLTEMRQVSILFITLKLSECPFLQMITIVNNSYQITCEIVYKSMGCVNKIILFDKDVMILVVFGLRGFKHESEAQAALKCAYSIKKSVTALDGVLEVSLGVTTGQVYCGVVGHPLRREFTVIGSTVNKAARLMCYFRNKITCDDSTFLKSKMSAKNFCLQPPIELKGISDAGKIYEYTEEIRVQEINDIPVIPPLLNRRDEIEYFQDWLNKSHSDFRDFDALMVVGESRIGKTRLIQWMARNAQNKKFKVCFVSLTSIHSANSYLALSQIINQILDISEPITGFTKEEKIVELLKGYDEDLCYLNNVIKVRFAFHEAINVQDEQKRGQKSRDIFMTIINALSETHVIFLDDIQNLDLASWEFVCLMFQSLKMFVVLSITRGKFSKVNSWLYDVFVNSRIRKIVLGPLGASWVAPLACQILDVDAVPNDLCNALRSKCRGMPGLIESFIVHLFSTGAIDVQKLNDNELETLNGEDLQFPEYNLLHPQALNEEDQEKLDTFLKENDHSNTYICIVTDKDQLNTNINMQNLDALIMIQIDKLTPYQQLLLKISSVIGDTISRYLLESIMYENNPITTAKAIKRLFGMRILACANLKKFRQSRNLSFAGSISSVRSNSKCECYCDFEYDPQENDNLPKHAFCKIMTFRNRNSRKTCYELLPMNQKKEFHSRIVHYLESNEHKCPDCGGKVMIVQAEEMPTNEELNFDYLNVTRESSSDEDESNHEIYTSKHPSGELIQPPTKSSSHNLNNSFINVVRAASEMINSGMSNHSFIYRHGSDHNHGRLHGPTDGVISPRGSVYSEISNRNLLHGSILKRKSNINENEPNKPIPKRVTVTDLDISENVNRRGPDILNTLREVIEADTNSDWHALGIHDSVGEMTVGKVDTASYKIKIESGVSKTDFSKCSCTELKLVIFEQMIHHSKQAELKEKTIEFLVKYCQMSLLENDLDYVFPKLDEAESICIDKNTNNCLTVFEKRRFLGKILTLRAAANISNRRLMVAKLDLERALRIYRLNIQNASSLLKFKNYLSAFNIKRGINKSSEIVMKTEALFCLNMATILYSALGDIRTARLATYRAISTIQKFDCEVTDICDAFSNAIQVELSRGNTDITVDIERIASNKLKSLSRPIKTCELCALGKFFISSFKARIARAQLTAATRSGFRSIVISHFLRADDITLEIIPDLVYVLLARRRISEAVEMIKEAHRLSHKEQILEAETWYYALCIDLILDAGIQIEPPNNISRYAEHSLFKGHGAGPARRRLVVGLWLYWLRADMDRPAKRFEPEALSWLGMQDDDGSLRTLISGIRLAEGMVESLARKIDDLRKVVDLMELRSLADRELLRLEDDARVCRTIFPRWLLLRAHSYKLSGRQTLAASGLTQALEEAKKFHNHLDSAAARAALNDSLQWVHCASEGIFPGWQTGAVQAETSWYKMLYKITTTRWH